MLKILKFGSWSQAWHAAAVHYKLEQFDAGMGVFCGSLLQEYPTDPRFWALGKTQGLGVLSVPQAARFSGLEKRLWDIMLVKDTHWSHSEIL